MKRKIYSERSRRGLAPSEWSDKEGLALSERSESRGFTLIELLVVVAIIGVLAGIIIVNLNIARLKSRDAKRRADLASVQMAVETYADQNGGVYPSTGVTFYNSVDNAAAGWVPNPVPPLPKFVPDYISVLPKDPKNTKAPDFFYAYRSDGNNYKIKASAMESPEGKKWAEEDGVNNTVYELFTAQAKDW